MVVAFSNFSSVLFTRPLSVINYLDSIVCLYLNASVTAQVEVKLSGMRDAAIHCGTWRDIPTLAALK